jgi:hypothetical protein
LINGPANTPFTQNVLQSLASGYIAIAAAEVPEAQRKVWATNHFVKFGHDKCRIFMDLPDSFDPIRYVNLRLDLIKFSKGYTHAQRFAFGQYHFVQFGKTEKRLWK